MRTVNKFLNFPLIVKLFFRDILLGKYGETLSFLIHKFSYSKEGNLWKISFQYVFRSFRNFYILKLFHKVSNQALVM